MTTISFEVAHIGEVTKLSDVVEEVAGALEVGAEEAALHARLAPGSDASLSCGDKFCSQASHDKMKQRAALLDAMADQLRNGTEAIRIP